MTQGVARPSRAAILWLFGTFLLLGLTLFTAIGLWVWSVWQRGAIHGAVRYGTLAEVEAVLDRSPERLEERDGLGLTPLHNAAWYGRVEALKVLIHRNADVNAVWDSPRSGDGGWNALHITAIEGHPEAAELLIQHGTLINHKSMQGETPLDVAIQNNGRGTGSGHARLIEILRAHGGKRGAELR